MPQDDWTLNISESVNQQEELDAGMFDVDDTIDVPTGSKVSQEIRKEGVDK